MRRRPSTVIGAAITLLVIALAGAYLYDASRDDLVSKGVTVGGVDVGGMRTAEARSALRRQFAARLEQPLKVVYRRHKFTLSPARARLRADIEGMLGDALEKSREGNVLSRAVRDLTGGEMHAALPSRVTYSKRAVSELVRRVKRRLDRPAQDARVLPSGTGLGKVPAKDGITIRGRELQKAIATKLAQPSDDYVVEAPVRVTEPKITTNELASSYPYFITIDRTTFRLRLFKNLKLKKTYRIGVGRAGFETPAGLYHIQNKVVNPTWYVPNRPWAGSLAGEVIPPGPENPLKARWMGIYDGAGIHGTEDVASIGTRASRGCIRMSIPEVKELYRQVPAETAVFIA